MSHWAWVSLKSTPKRAQCHPSPSERLPRALSLALCRQAFIPVSQEVPALDAAYLAERAAAYTSSLRPSAGPSAGTSLPLKPTRSTPPPPPSAGGLEAALERMLLKPPTAAADAALARSTASAAAGGLADVAVRGKHEVLVTVG